MHPPVIVANRCRMLRCKQAVVAEACHKIAIGLHTIKVICLQFNYYIIQTSTHMKIAGFWDNIC